MGLIAVVGGLISLALLIVFYVVLFSIHGRLKEAVQEQKSISNRLFEIHHFLQQHHTQHRSDSPKK